MAEIDSLPRDAGAAGSGPLSGPLWTLFLESHASLGATWRTRLRRMSQFARYPICGTKLPTTSGRSSSAWAPDVVFRRGAACLGTPI